MTTRNDESLAAMLQAHYVELAPALHAWAALRLPRTLAGRLEPEEILQATWLRALETRATFAAGGTPFRPWIFGVAGYVLLESLRGAARGGANSGRDAESVRNLPAEITSASRRASRDEALGCFVVEAKLLGPEERQLLLFRGLEGLPYDVIAARLGIAPATAMKRWQRLRETLAGRLRLRGIVVED